MTNGGMATHMLAAYHLGRAGGIFGLNYLEVGVLLEEVMTLHQGHGV